MADQLVGIISNNMIRSNIQRWTTHHGTIITRTNVVSTSVVSVCTLLCYPAYGKRQPCTVVSVRITELKTHHAERGAAQERIHENAWKESLVNHSQNWKYCITWTVKHWTEPYYIYFTTRPAWILFQSKTYNGCQVKGVVNYVPCKNIFTLYCMFLNWCNNVLIKIY